MKFTVYGVAQPAGSKRVVPAGGKRGGKLFVTDDNRRAKPWQRDVATVARAAVGEAEPLEGPLALELVFVVARPKGHYGVNGVKASAPLLPIVRPDVLKLARAVEDALTGIVYRDDAQIVLERLGKVYGDPPRCDVTVTPMVDATTGALRALEADN